MCIHDKKFQISRIQLKRATSSTYDFAMRHSERKFKLANIVHRITRLRTRHVTCMRRTIFFRSNFIQAISTSYKSRVTRAAISRRLPRKNRPIVRLLVHGHLTLAHFPFLKKARPAFFTIYRSRCVQVMSRASILIS
jgi:hypothetical protein